MSENSKKSGWLNTKPNSAKTLIERAKREVPGFEGHFKKFEQHTTLGGYASSTIFNYSRAVAKLSLHFGKSILELDAEEINSFLFELSKSHKVSSTYFKHTVYGLRYFLRLYDREDTIVKMPKIKSDRKLPVVLSHQELRRLFHAPGRLKQRVLLALIYSAGLRVGEACNLKLTDIDSDRMTIRVEKSKGKTDRYVPLSAYVLKGLRRYVKSVRPKKYLFNGREKGSKLGTSAVQQSFRLAKSKAGINKEVSVHTLRHTYATHLLEQGVDLVTIKELLGHAHIDTTLMYLHVAQFDKKRAHSPLDTLYHSVEAKV